MKQKPEHSGKFEVPDPQEFLKEIDSFTGILKAYSVVLPLFPYL